MTAAFVNVPVAVVRAVTASTFAASAVDDPFSPESRALAIFKRGVTNRWARTLSYQSAKDVQAYLVPVEATLGELVTAKASGALIRTVETFVADLRARLADQIKADEALKLKQERAEAARSDQARRALRKSSRQLREKILSVEMEADRAKLLKDIAEDYGIELTAATRAALIASYHAGARKLREITSQAGFIDMPLPENAEEWLLAQKKKDQELFATVRGELPT